MDRSLAKNTMKVTEQNQNRTISKKPERTQPYPGLLCLIKILQLQLYIMKLFQRDPRLVFESNEVIKYFWVFTNQCSVLNVQCLVFTVQCLVFSVLQCLVFSVLQCLVFSVQCFIVFSVQYLVFYCVQCLVCYSVQCLVSSNLKIHHQKKI